jgi:plastocyanin
MRARSLAAGICLVLAVAASMAAGAETLTVAIDGMKFVPETLTVKPGDRIVWQNKDVVPHTVTARGSFDSHSIETGKSWSMRAPKAGRYDYVCTFHPGMKATLVVQ